MLDTFVTLSGKHGTGADALGIKFYRGDDGRALHCHDIEPCHGDKSSTPGFARRYHLTNRLHYSMLLAFRRRISEAPEDNVNDAD